MPCFQGEDYVVMCSKYFGGVEADTVTARTYWNPGGRSRSVEITMPGVSGLCLA